MKHKILPSALALGLTFCTVLPSFGIGVDYITQKGESYYSISNKFDVAFNDLLLYNNANKSNELGLGQKISVPVYAVHTVISGDTYYKISVKCGVSIDKLLLANGANQYSVLNIGDKILIPGGVKVHIVQSGEGYYKISQNYGVNFNTLLYVNGATSASTLKIGQKILIPKSAASAPTATTQPVTQKTEPWVSYDNYTIKAYDTFWSLGEKFGIPYAEILSANKMSESTSLKAGMIIKIPVHHVPVMTTPGEKYGEYLDWWTQAQYVIPTNAVFTVVDYYSGKSFKAKRTTGASHADCEPMTANDTAMMREIWGGTLNWNKRPVIIIYNGRRIAASAASMSHAGNDATPGGEWTSWRSDGYGAGPNFDWVKGNNFDGHFDIHFKNSTTHNTGEINATHQANIKISAGK